MLHYLRTWSNLATWNNFWDQQSCNLKHIILKVYIWSTEKEKNTHTHNRLQTRTIGMELPTEDTRFLINHSLTMEIVWLFTTQSRTCPIPPIKVMVQTAFLHYFHHPAAPWTEDRPWCIVSFVKFHVCVLVWRHLHIHTHAQINWSKSNLPEKYVTSDSEWKHFLYSIILCWYKFLNIFSESLLQKAMGRALLFCIN